MIPDFLSDYLECRHVSGCTAKHWIDSAKFQMELWPGLASSTSMTHDQERFRSGYLTCCAFPSTACRVFPENLNRKIGENKGVTSSRVIV
jgi:hypothetical protein